MWTISNTLGVEHFHQAVRDFVAEFAYTSFTSSEFGLYLDDKIPSDPLPLNTKTSEILARYAAAFSHREVVYVDIRSGQFEVSYSGSFQFSPVDYMTPTSEAAHAPKLWFTASYGYIPLARGPEEWIVVNPDQFGMYMVDYRGDLWNGLATQLQTDHTIFSRRSQFISDCTNQLINFSRDIRFCLDLIAYLAKEEDLYTIRATRISYEQINFRLSGSDYQGSVQPLYDYYIELLADRYLANRINADMKEFAWTMELAMILCNAGYAECISDVESYYQAATATDEGLSGSSDFQSFIICTLAKTRSNLDSLVEQVMMLWIEDREIHSKGRNAIIGIACSRDEKVIDK